MGVVVLVIVVIVVVGMPAAFFWGIARLFLRAWRNIPPGEPVRRSATVAALLLALCAPYLAYKAFELRHVLALVPKPMHVVWIDYRRQESWGIGGPGDNETGFIAYRLTVDSAHWAQEKAAQLSEAHQPGADGWLPTPVDDTERARGWHDEYSDRHRAAHRADIAEYLEKYGFGISVDRRWLDQANRAARQSGSFYRYDRGGRVTIVDPAAGYVYVAYAG